MSDRPIAPLLDEVLRPVLNGPLPVRLRAWDGSAAGPTDAPQVTLTHPDALRRMVWHPGELGVAQAYVAGDLTMDAPVVDVLRHAWRTARTRGLIGRRRASRGTASAIVHLVRELGLGTPPDPPSTQIAVKGRLHSRRRDRQVVRHHYDLSNAFYRLVLDETMTYSCAHATAAALSAGEEIDACRLADAQRDKLDLVCRRIGLDRSPGMRLLDVGCGWGSLDLYAAEHFGARVTGVTLSAEQKRYIDAEIASRGLTDRVDIRLQDYRDVDDEPYDAVASLEMGEHAGDRGYPAYVEVLRRHAAPGARILIQQMSRSGPHPGGGPFIEAFIAPDMTMRPLGSTIALLESGGLEVQSVRSLRAHYAWTIRAWERRFEAHRARLHLLVGPEIVRVWQLYLAGGHLAFEQGRMGVHQIVATSRASGTHD